MYDVERRLDEVVQADGQVLHMHYNASTGQLTSVDVPDDGTYAFTYYPTTGNVNTVTGPAGTTTIQTLQLRPGRAGGGHGSRERSVHRGCS